MTPGPRPSREGWSAGHASSYHPANHVVSSADVIAGLLLFASVFGGLAVLPERAGPPVAETVRQAQASHSGVDAVAKRKAGC
jgi:hypothetical protein